MTHACRNLGKFSKNKESAFANATVILKNGGMMLADSHQMLKNRGTRPNPCFFNDGNRL